MSTTNYQEKPDNGSRIATNSNSELRMYIVVNTDVKMGKGKIAAQVGHAVMLITEYMMKHRQSAYEQYKLDGMAKITLKSNLTTIRKLSEDPTCVVIHDAGRTQVAPNTLTVIAFPPMTEETKAKFYSGLNELKLL